ncbi:hypothetical protein HHO41_02215 [Bacillus sp. DNRA2]|uniref:hypothetical protein n=1 Tax=Bacillus sp. DNRA2 TaxID=2723053 RepID=UPI00145CD845|nr:hypothetical protein [Bacillus sp. DNRA2]NMD69087.1 hypothetical protein [Bacillus sp. DNRA2]
MNKQGLTNKHKLGQLFDFSEFKKNKPFFTKPMSITVGQDSQIETYFLLKNIVYKGKQILALRNEQEPCTILLAEGKIDNGKLQCLIKLPEDSLSEITALFEGNTINTMIVDNN